MNRNDGWLSSDEFPDEKDVEAFGDDAPADFDPLTIGYVGDSRPPYWTKRRIFLLVAALIFIAISLMPTLARLF